MYPPKQPLKLIDCAQHGAGTELFIVEGDSAAGAVANVRDTQTQAVLPMQGKPLNAVKAGHDKTQAFPLYIALLDALGCGYGKACDASKARFERIILLMDPDADGIHCGALMLLFCYRGLMPLLEAERVLLALAPMASVSSAAVDQPLLPHTDAEFRNLLKQFNERGITDVQTTRYRGLAGIDLPTLAYTCLHPSTRRTRVLTRVDAEEALAVFGGGA
jgi:DNA gyrase subunit B